jgi:tetratricopeptide (TPR) repeat protein
MKNPMPGAGILHIIGGNDRGKQFELNKPEIRIGRGTDQDVVLADIAVSRRHVTIVTEGQRFRLKDLGSGNGSLVNGQRVDTVILNDGDQIEIGNTLMRFDHAASRPIAAAPASVPPGYPPQSYPGMPGMAPGMVPPGYPGYPPGYPVPPGYPPSYPGMAPPGYSMSGYAAHPGPAYPSGYPPPPGYPPPSFGGVAGDPSVSLGQPIAPSYHGPPSRTSARKSPIATTGGKLLVFGSMAVLSIASLAAIISKSFAQPVPVQNEAEDLYRQGLRLFAAADYELAKAKFTEATSQAPDAPEPRRYARLCDTEMQARTSLKNAERALVARRYAEAVRALDGIEPTSVNYEAASKLRKDSAPKAAAEMIEEARRLWQENPEEARSRIKSALELDPNNYDGRELLNRLRVGGPPPASAPSSLVSRNLANPPPSAATAAAVARDTPKEPAVRRTPGARAPKAAAAGDDDGDLATVKVGKAPAGPVAAPPDSKSGMAAYKSRDFAGAVKLLRQDSMKQTEKQAMKTLEFANQVQQLQQLVDRATADEAKNASQAVKEYEQAIQLDQRLSRGVHVAYFRQRIGGLGVQAAKQAFAAGKYEEAYSAALQAQKGGADAGPIIKQLEQKAGELVNQGVAAQKSNIGQAKQYWRTVLKMVPSSSPNYTKAYSLLNSAAKPSRDEDED